MTVKTRTERIAAPDGSGAFDAHVALPAAGSGPGLLVIQEIFGITHYVRTRCADLAALGYVAMAPDVFWRIEPNIELGHGQADLQRGVELGQRFDASTGIPDLCAALSHLRTRPETAGRPCGVLGYCFGGTLAYALACRADPDVAISYYGSGVASMLDQGSAITCPTLFHFGNRDPYIPSEAVAAVAAFSADKPMIEHRVYDGGHAFDNLFHPMFADPEPQAQAWSVTRSFLAEHLPVT